MGDLALASDQADGGCDRQPGGERDRAADGLCLGEGIPGHLEDLDGLGQPLELHLAQSMEGVGDATPRHHPHELGGEDLATPSLGAQPRRLDDRVAKVVIPLSAGLPGAEPHPQPQGALAGPVLPVDGLLHGHCAGEGGRAAGEHHHDPVAQVLDLGATRRGDGLAQRRKVCPAQRICGLGRERRGKLGRSDEIRE